MYYVCGLNSLLSIQMHPVGKNEHDIIHTIASVAAVMAVVVVCEGCN